VNPKRNISRKEHPHKPLEKSLEGYLTDSWITSAGHLAKGSGVDVA
jgi:hypothetical protein